MPRKVRHLLNSQISRYLLFPRAKLKKGYIIILSRDSEVTLSHCSRSIELVNFINMLRH
jgi:hypothetical protein